MIAPNATTARIPSLKIDDIASTEFLEIVLSYSDYIVVSIDYNYLEVLPQGSLIGELDLNGQGLARIPLEQIKSVHTDEEMESIMGMIAADEKLLGYAH